MSGNPAIRPRRRTILVADDNTPHLRVCAQVLQQAGFTVLTASDGAAAMRTLALDTSVDLLVTDIFMPEKDGFDTITALKRTGRRIPVIAMSGGGLVTSAEDVLAHSRDLGAVAVLAKPFTEEQLLAAVHAALGTAR